MKFIFLSVLLTAKILCKSDEGPLRMNLYEELTPEPIQIDDYNDDGSDIQFSDDEIIYERPEPIHIDDDPDIDW